MKKTWYENHELSFRMVEKQKRLICYNSHKFKGDILYLKV